MISVPLPPGLDHPFTKHGYVWLDTPTRTNQLCWVTSLDDNSMTLVAVAANPAAYDAFRSQNLPRV
jgi:hypothetical protein